jgi:hypothetical protein
MKQATSKVTNTGEGGMHVYIPSKVRNDSQNPLKVGDKILVSVDGQKMTLEPIREWKMRVEEPEAGNLQNSDGLTSNSNAFQDNITCGYIFKQCFGKGQNNQACTTCSEKEKCLAEA